MKQVALVLHNTRENALHAAIHLARALADHGVAVRALEHDAARVGDPVTACTPETFSEDLDLVFSLGGDGTMLRAAALVARSAIPILGVKLGHLGFLTEMEMDALDGELGHLVNDEYEIDERMALEGEVVVDGARVETIWALNDLIVEKSSPGRSIRLAVAIDGSPFASLAADGIIVATPTGSTAYSFSARGPIVSPALRCMIVTPVSAHMLFDRSVVTGPDGSVTLTVLPDPDPVSVSLDGRLLVEVPAGTEVRVRPCPTPVRLARVHGRAFWSVVRSKFGLPFDRAE